jgi:hypothetical protein
VVTAKLPETTSTLYYWAHPPSCRTARRGSPTPRRRRPSAAALSRTCRHARPPACRGYTADKLDVDAPKTNAAHAELIIAPEAVAADAFPDALTHPETLAAFGRRQARALAPVLARAAHFSDLIIMSGLIINPSSVVAAALSPVASESVHSGEALHSANKPTKQATCRRRRRALPPRLGATESSSGPVYILLKIFYRVLLPSSQLMRLYKALPPRARTCC